MEKYGVTNSQISELKQFVNLLQLHPEFLHDEKLSFFKEYIISLGGTIPEIKKEEPKPTETTQEMSESSEEEESEEETFEEVKIEDDEIVPEDIVEEETISMEIEVTEEMEIEASTKRSEAMEAFNMGEKEKAIELITEAIKCNPKVANLYAIRAQYYNRMKRPNAAIRDCTKAIQLNPDNAKAYKMRGMAYRMLGKYELSVVDLRLGNRLDYDDNTYEMQKIVEKFVNVKKQNEKKKEEIEQRKKQKQAEKERKQREKEQKKHQEEHDHSHKGCCGNGGCCGQKRQGCDGKGGCGRNGGCCGGKQGGCCGNKSQGMPNFGGMPNYGMPNMGNMGGMPNMNGMPGMGGMGGMPNMPGMENLFAELARDPELMAAFQDPEVVNKLSECMSNPGKIMELMGDPKLGPIIAKLMGKFGQQ